jgi:uncharacterized delta-60 repeat protein
VTRFRASAGAYAVAIEPDGKIVVAGAAHRHGQTYDWAVARYTKHGRLDASFGTGGKVLTDFGSLTFSGSEEPTVGVAIEPDGKIVVAGGSKASGTTHDFALARYTTTGTLDRSFGTRGKVQTDFGSPSGAAGVAIEPDGKIVVAGYKRRGAREDFALARYRRRGALDPSFGTDGKVVTHFKDGAAAALAVAIQPDGKIVVTGYAGDAIALARYLP